MSPTEPIDHSRTYREFRLRNIPHQLRLRRIMTLLGEIGLDGRSWADVGCSNAYIISTVLNVYRPSEVYGFDHSESNLVVAKESVPTARFEFIDLNDVVELPRRFDVVSCFETLEHVGNLQRAVKSIVGLVRPGGTLLVTVPIETGLGGSLKYLLKRGIYRYSLKELPGGESRRGEYARALLSGSRISAFRSEPREGWGTHFGFDWRDVDDLLQELNVQYDAKSGLFSRYYVVHL